MMVPGQRWVSLTEPDLGLGLVVQVDRHHVQVLFPGGAETRTYSIESAPLKRAHFAVGDTVRGCDGDPFVVTVVHEADFLLSYEGEGRTLSEAALADSLSVEDPESRLLAGHVDASALFDLRLSTLQHRHRASRSPVRGFTGARIELLPHQLYIASEVSRRQIPRVLLADEVGLGKTIEACLILHRLVVCGKANRILVLLPEPLLHQWFVELLRRFNLSFRVFDKQQCDAESKSGSQNPFLESQFVLCGLEFLVNDQARAQQALAAGWDLLVVDEAHHLRWSEAAPSREYQLVARFAANAPGLLLLTASPEQTGMESHFARLRLLDPHRYPDLEQFVAEHETYNNVAARAAAVLAEGREDELQDMLDRHGPGRVMFRNSRAVMAGFPKRIPHLVPLDSGSEGGVDPRVVWLSELLRQDSTRKVLVICATARDVLRLEKALRGRMGIDIAGFHEELPLIQCDRQAAWFAEPKGARVLITSGIGGEGRNYQFASDMVLMDVPEDPELVEQRIGRLDRIGQENDIHIHVPFVRGTPEAGRIRWLHEGLGAFSRPLVGGYQMLLQFGRRLGEVSDALIDETRRAHQALCERVEAGRNLLLEMNSCRPAVAESLVAAIREAEADPSLEAYMGEVFEQFGVDCEPIGDHDYVLSADLLFCDEFPLPRGGDAMRVTYDRRHALSRPTITLLSWDHPMVQGAMDLVVGSDRGACAVARSNANSGVLLQGVYVLEAVSSQRLEIERFLPPTPIVVQVNEHLEAEDAAWSVDGDGESWWVSGNDRLRLELLPAMVTASREQAERAVGEVRDDARRAMANALGDEIVRLRELQKVNDHVRPEEIAAAEAQVVTLSEAIEGARLRLDAIRLIVGTRGMA
jgi:ATP-dependent helicase HepA